MLRPGYAPIEQYTDDNESEQGPWTDIYALGAVLHTLIIGSPPPVSVVRSIQDTYMPLTQRNLPGYSPSLLQAVDRALALKMEDRPQTVDEFAALIEMPVAGLDDVLSVKQRHYAGAGWKRRKRNQRFSTGDVIKCTAPVAAGVVVGLVAGGMLFSGGSSDNSAAAQTASTQNDSSVTQSQQTAPENSASSQPSAPPAQSQPSTQSATPVATQGAAAQIFVRMNEGEKLTLNGESQSVTPATNGFASLKLQPGHYELVLQGNGQTRSQSFNIAKAGTGLINPQPK